MDDQQPQIWFRWRDRGIFFLWWPVHWKGYALMLAFPIFAVIWIIFCALVGILPNHEFFWIAPMAIFVFMLAHTFWRHSEKNSDS